MVHICAAYDEYAGLDAGHRCLVSIIHTLLACCDLQYWSRAVSRWTTPPWSQLVTKVYCWYYLMLIMWNISRYPSWSFFAWNIRMFLSQVLSISCAPGVRPGWLGLLQCTVAMVSIMAWVTVAVQVCENRATHQWDIEFVGEYGVSRCLGEIGTLVDVLLI